MSRGSMSKFKKVVLKGHIGTLGDLLSSLLQGLSNIEHLAYDDEQKFQKNKNLLNEMSDELNKLKADYENKQEELNILQDLLQNEREKQQDLSPFTKKLENDLNILFLQKEKWKKKVFEISRLCSALKNIFSENCDVLNLKTEVATLSDTFSLCHTCLTEPEELDEKSNDHVLFTPVTLIHFVAELFTSKSDFEREVLKLEECKSIMEQEIVELENNKSLLQQSIDDLEGNVNTLKHELENLKSKCSCLENEYQNINSLYIESNVIREDQENCLRANMEEICNCKKQYQELLSEYQKAKNYLVEKEEEISNYEKCIQDKVSKYEDLNTKCKNYEIEIQKLNTAITELNDIKEVKNNLLSQEEINNSLITEMKSKIAALEKSNNLLNVTVETVEEELQNVYAEKQNFQEKLLQKQDEIERLQHEIILTGNKIVNDRNGISRLESTVEILQKEIEEAKTKHSELLHKNSILQNDITLLEKDRKNHEMLIIEKNCCIQQNNLMINQLKEKTLIIADERKNLEINKTETEVKLKNELQEKDTLLYDLDKKINLMSKEKADLETHISALLLSEAERTKALLEKESSELKCKEFIEQIDVLRTKLENFELQAISAENKHEKAVQCIQNLNLEIEKYVQELNTLKKEISFTKKSNAESSVLIQNLQKELNDNLEACEKAKENTLKLSKENEDLIKEINSIKAQSKRKCKCEKNSSVLEPNLVKSENIYKECLAKVINLLITVINDIEYDNDSDKRDLISLLSKWESNLNNSSYFTSEIKLKLQSLLEYEVSKQKKSELNLYSLKEFICKFTTELQQFCESEEHESKLNFTMLGDKSCFEESLSVSPSKYKSFFVLNSCVDDLKNSFSILESCFSSIKSIILKKDLEIKSLQERASLEKVKTETNTGQKKIEIADYTILENKNKLLLSNAYRLEKHYHKLQETNQELEARIKVLEQEKLELDAEADEMAEIIKQQNSSDELTDLYKTLSESSKKLVQLKEENQCLKALHEYWKEILEKHGISLSALSGNMEQDANALG